MAPGHRLSASLQQPEGLIVLPGDAGRLSGVFLMNKLLLSMAAVGAIAVAAPAASQTWSNADD